MKGGKKKERGKSRTGTSQIRPTKFKAPQGRGTRRTRILGLALSMGGILLLAPMTAGVSDIGLRDYVTDTEDCIKKGIIAYPVTPPTPAGGGYYQLFMKPSPYYSGQGALYVSWSYPGGLETSIQMKITKPGGYEERIHVGEEPTGTCIQRRSNVPLEFDFDIGGAQLHGPFNGNCDTVAYSNFATGDPIAHYLRFGVDGKTIMHGEQTTCASNTYTVVGDFIGSGSSTPCICLQEIAFEEASQ